MQQRTVTEDSIISFFACAYGSAYSFSVLLVIPTSFLVTLVFITSSDSCIFFSALFVSSAA